MVNTWRLVYDGLTLLVPFIFAFFVGFAIGRISKTTEKETKHESTDTE